MIIRRRVARKSRPADCCSRLIKVGDPYLEVTQMPGDEDAPTERPVRFRECVACAHRYGRGPVVTPVPEGFVVIPVPYVHHAGPNDTVESLYARAAWNLDREHPIGGSNLIRSVSHTLHDIVKNLQIIAKSKDPDGRE